MDELFCLNIETKLTFFVYGILSLLSLFVFIGINYYAKDLIAKQNPSYTQNQLVIDDGYTADYSNDSSNKQQIPEINNAVNPMMLDTNFYYQPSHSNQDLSKSQLNSTSK